jgi:hypothetical protein
VSESTIKLPIEVSDKGAIQELRRIQSTLGAVGLESVTLNKRVATAMESMAAKSGAAFDDISRKAKGATTDIVSFNQALEVGKKILDFGKKAVELAKFSAEFHRLKDAVPVAKLRELERATQGTVSQFELLKRAAKEMKLDLDTAGMTDSVRKVERVQVAWANFMTDVKVGLGDMVNEIGYAAGRLLGIVEASRAERLNAGSRGTAMRTGKFTTSNLNEYTSPFGFVPGVGIANDVMGNITGNAEIAQQTLDFEARRATAFASTARVMQIEKAAEGTFGAGMFAQQFGQGIAQGATGKDGKRAAGGRAAGPGESFFWNLNPNNPNALQNQPWAARATGVLAEAGGAALNEYRAEDSLFGGISNLAGGAGRLAGGIGRGAQGGIDEFAKRAEEINKPVREMEERFGGAFSAFGGAIGAAVDAAITGSESIGKAFLKASAAALKSLAVESSVRAAYNLAMGIGSAAIGSPKAGGFFAAAAQFAATAALAGGGAAVLNAAGGGGSSASSGGGNARDFAPVTGARAESGPQNITVNVTVGAAADAGRLGETITKAVDLADRQGRGRSERNVVVRYE